MLVELTPDQIKLLNNTTKLGDLAEMINVYLKDYHELHKNDMHRKRRGNIELIGRVVVPYLKNVDQLLNQIRDQVKA